MRIHRLRLANYRGVQAREISFAEQGVTVVEGPNEAGKSSLAEAIDLLLEHFDDSKRAAVRATKPVHADVGTEVEAELSAGPYRFTYAKRFHKDRSTTLTVHAPRAEQLTGREAHERVRAILSETVDLPLWQALRIVQGQAVEQPDLTGVSALAAALDVAAGGAGPDQGGGEREHSLLERVQSEYARYFTPTGQDNAWMKGVRAEFEQAEAEVAGARRALAALEQDIECCARIARELEGLRPEYQRQLERLADLERRWLAVQQRAAQVEKLSLQAERAAEALQAAEHRAAERTRLAEAAAGAAARAAAAEAERAQLEPALRTAVEAEQRLQAQVTALRAELAQAREDERAAGEAEARSREAFSLELLEERWARVAEGRAQAAEAREVLEAVTLDEAAVERIETAHLAAAQARGRLEDEGPALRLVARAAAELELDGAVVGLAEGEERELAITEQVRLRIGDVEAVLSPGHGLSALRDRHEEAERELGDACRAAGVEGLAEARAALRRRQDAERGLAEAERILRDNLRDLSPDELQEKIGKLRERVSVAAGADVDAAKRAREDAERRVHELEADLARAEGALREAVTRRGTLREQDTALAVRLEQAAQELAAATAALDEARAAHADDELRGLAAAAATLARDSAAAFMAARAELDADDPASREAELGNARELADKQRVQLREREDDLQNLRGRLSALGEVGLHDRLAAAETRLERARVAWGQASRGAAAARLLHDTLLRHREAARRAYVAPLREKLESLGRIVFGTDFAVELDDELRVARRTLDGVTLDVEQLSSGAREQLAVLSRLAVAAITAGDGGVPVILDDALGWSDPDRLEKMGAAFHVASRDSQVIVLTCVPERYHHIGSATVVRL